MGDDDTEWRYSKQLGLLLSTAVVFVLSVALAWDTIRQVFQILTDAIFLSGLGVVLLSALTTTILAGGLGVALGYMIEKKEFLSHYTLRFLRLGLWLPVYLFWGLSIWRIPVHDDGFVLGLSKIGTGVIATGPSVFLAACYHYLCAPRSKAR